MKTRFLPSVLLLFCLPSLAYAQDLGEEWRTVAYGTQPPLLRCHPLGGCFLMFEPGETVTAHFLFDRANWELVSSSAGPKATTLFALKPRACGLATGMTVATDRRIYSVTLESSCLSSTSVTAADLASDYVRFSYPLAFAQVPPSLSPPVPSPASPGSPLPQLHFDYQISRKLRGPRVRHVYDDGVRTYVVLPPRSAELPAIFVRGQDNDLELVNVIAPPPGQNTLVVDRVTQELVLLSGKRASQKTVIRRGDVQ